MPKKGREASQPSEDEANEGETTLLSVVRRMSPIAKTHDTSIRKTPFGVIRIPSGAHVSAKQVEKSTEQIDYTTLPSIRQRTRYGIVQWSSLGVLSYTYANEDLTLLLDLRSNTADFRSRQVRKACTYEEAKDTKVYRLAVQWLLRYSRNVIVCTYRTRYQAGTCNVYANGPQPDFQLTYRQKQKADRYGKITTIRISRQQGTVTLWASLLCGDGKEGDICTQSVILPLQHVQYHNSSSPLLIDFLRPKELDLVRKTLALVEEVDTVYATICRGHLRYPSQ